MFKEMRRNDSESGDGSLTHDLSKVSQLYLLQRSPINLKLHNLAIVDFEEKELIKKSIDTTNSCKAA
ncbi:hypothetical protein UFO1_3421 [Pelosinus sp. UFO1]|nr:hypothetical protein UFO1_3421 [Pelosinus sp. UFO1]